MISFNCLSTAKYWLIELGSDSLDNLLKVKVKYGSLPKTSNTLNIRTPKIIAKYNFKMFPKISNSG